MRPRADRVDTLPTMFKRINLYTFVTPAKEALSPEDVRHILEERFRQEGRKDRVVGAITARGEDFFVAEICDTEGRLIKRAEINRVTGAWSA